MDHQQPIVQFARDPGPQQVEARFSQYRREAFQKHTHDTYSIGLVRLGQTRFCLHRQVEALVTVGKGDLVLIHPGEVHACNPMPGSVLSYYMLYVDPALMEQVVDGPADEPAGEIFFQQPVIRDPELSRDLIAVCRRMFQAEDRLEIETRRCEALAKLILRYGNRLPQSAGHPRDTGNVHLAHNYLMDNLARNVSLRELAEQSGLSPYHFLRAFRSRYGLPPHTYQLQQRISLARRLLARGEPIVAVAVEVGFADQSHFTRKFKASVGVTPWQYQRGM